MLASTARRVGAVGAKNIRATASERSFFTGVFADHPGQNPLTEEFPGVPAVQPTARATGDLKVSTLSNGLRVASQETASPVASVGVYVDAGSRTEQRSEAGLSYLLQRLAFKSTQTRSSLRLTRDIEDAGLHVSALSSRDTLVYSGEGARSHVGDLVSILGESVMEPLLADWEVAMWQGITGAYDTPVIEGDANIALSEATHAAAFQDDTPLGHSSYVSSATLGNVSSNDLRAFITRNFAANKMVVSAAGVSHDELVSSVEKVFGSAPATAEGSAGSASYLGGYVRSAAPGPVAYYSISFEGASLADGAAGKNVAAFRVLKSLLGTSVESYEGVGNRQSRLAQLESNDPSVGVATAFNRFYRDAGLFGVYAAADEASAGTSFKKVAEAIKASASVSAEELTRAKNQAKMEYLSSVDFTCGLRNDIGSQLLLTNARAEASAVAAAIDAVTAADVERAATGALASDVSVAAVGAVANVPRYGTASKLFA